MGQLGRGNNSVCTNLESVIEVRNAIFIAAGFDHGMAICTDEDKKNLLYIWGCGSN